MMIAIMFGTRITVIYVSHHDEADGGDGDDVEGGCPPQTPMVHIYIYIYIYISHTITMVMVMMMGVTLSLIHIKNEYNTFTPR